jgi:repressor LexA
MPATDATPTIAITPKQREVLDFIRRFIEANHYAPTYEEIRVGLQFSTKSLVDYHLTHLEAAGYIGRQSHTPRAIYLMAHD